eukprot:13045446-Alexandrium_andersonii.AAC.1
MRAHAEVEVLELRRGAEVRQYLEWLAEKGHAEVGGAAHGRLRTEQLLSQYLGPGVASRKAIREWQRRFTGR